MSKSGKEICSERRNLPQAGVDMIVPRMFPWKANVPEEARRIEA
jgi:hypothetical protein